MILLEIQATSTTIPATSRDFARNWSNIAWCCLNFTQNLRQSKQNRMITEIQATSTTIQATSRDYIAWFCANFTQNLRQSKQNHMICCWKSKQHHVIFLEILATSTKLQATSRDFARFCANSTQNLWQSKEIAWFWHNFTHYLRKSKQYRMIMSISRKIYEHPSKLAWLC